MIRVGKIVATHGLQGAVIMTHIVGNSKWLKSGSVLQVEMQKGSFIPYFVGQCKAANDEEYIINIEEVEKVESAKKLITKHVYVNEDILSSFAKDSPLLWIGFNLVDVQKGGIGVIDDVMQTGKQWLGRVMIDDTEVLIPLIEQTIKQVDIKNRFIRVDLPEGLLEIYLNK